ncbi:class I SAM-dependent methyltransferase [Mycolicibacterium arseniciresistens]|uniref:Methyltransferase domain-containing protein n=1 Tax=Mycolicibacterium arseniciresistens TaxID=3062257 RepID=A0ABT8U9W5_9MYCO|nr:methyltransferase domain-containing protein [Mycolicibacterium arseniciresistens]MDO3634580.1 methyltransferase domain-containing protein [Mycolicibacterium arseniciresistens]
MRHLVSCHDTCGVSMKRNGLRWYQLVYRFLYRVGLVIWQRGAPPAELIALVEGPSALPAGRALELGCGTGTDTVYLATHVTAVDMVPKALGTARRKASGAGVAPRFIEGDVTRLSDLGLGDGYDLLLDFGCFHTLPADRRPPYVASLSSAAAPGATLLLYGFKRPPKAAPIRGGVTAEEVQKRFCPAGWDVVSAERAAVEIPAVRGAADRFELWCYHLTRKR